MGGGTGTVSDRLPHRELELGKVNTLGVKVVHDQNLNVFTIMPSYAPLTRKELSDWYKVEVIDLECMAMIKLDRIMRHFGIHMTDVTIVPISLTSEEAKYSFRIETS